MISHSYIGDEHATIVTSTLTKKQVVFLCPLSQYQEGIEKYKQGALIQNAFPFLSVNDREFLISGMTAEEFDALFRDDNGY